MAKAKSDLEGEWDETMIQNHEGDLDDFIDSMEAQGSRRSTPSRGAKSGRQRVDDWNESRLLKMQLQDWDDWDGLS